MSNKNITIVGIFLWVLLLGVALAHPKGSGDTGESGGKGYLEVDCNISNVSLYLCPKDNFTQKEIRSFFGLISSRKDICSGGELFIGTTPLSPTPIPSGRYVLVVSSDYVWEKKGPIEITIKPGKRVYFLQKLFSTRADRPEDDHGGGGGGAGGGGSR